MLRVGVAAVPVVFGVLTVNTEEQAKDRSTGSNNHGIQWGKAAVEMAHELATLRATAADPDDGLATAMTASPSSATPPPRPPLRNANGSSATRAAAPIAASPPKGVTSPARAPPAPPPPQEPVTEVDTGSKAKLELSPSKDVVAPQPKEGNGNSSRHGGASPVAPSLENLGEASLTQALREPLVRAEHGSAASGAGLRGTPSAGPGEAPKGDSGSPRRSSLDRQASAGLHL